MTDDTLSAASAVSTDLGSEQKDAKQDLLGSRRSLLFKGDRMFWHLVTRIITRRNRHWAAPSS